MPYTSSYSDNSEKENGKTQNVLQLNSQFLFWYNVQLMHKHSKVDVAVKQQGFVIAHPCQFNLFSCDNKNIATDFAWIPTLEVFQISKLHGTHEIFISLS